MVAALLAGLSLHMVEMEELEEEQEEEESWQEETEDVRLQSTVRQLSGEGSVASDSDACLCSGCKKKSLVTVW